MKNVKLISLSLIIAAFAQSNAFAEGVSIYVEYNWMNDDYSITKMEDTERSGRIKRCEWAAEIVNKRRVDPKAQGITLMENFTFGKCFNFKEPPEQGMIDALAKQFGQEAKAEMEAANEAKRNRPKPVNYDRRDVRF